MAPQAGFVCIDRQELIADIPINATNTIYALPTNGGLIPNDRYMFGLLLTVEGRMTNPVANGPIGVNAGGVLNLIENLTVQGTHRIRGQNEQFINLRGVDLFNLVRAQDGFHPMLYPSSVGWPAWTQVLTPINEQFNDFRYHLWLPFIPMNTPSNAQMGYLLDAPNYDSLKLSLQFGDATSVFTGQTTQPTFSAYGSAAGNPRVRVEGQFALGGNFVQGYVPARTWRYFVENTSGDIVSANAPNSRQYNIPRGNKIRSIYVKTGVRQTGQTAGLNPYATMSDDVFANIKIQRGLNKSIRFYPAQRSIKHETNEAYKIWPADGVQLIDFAKRGRLIESLDTVGLIAGPSGDTDVYLQADVTGGANFGSLFLVEEIRGMPRKLGATGVQSASGS